MRSKHSKKNKDKFFYYLIISLVLHLALFMIMPFGNLINVANSEGKGNKDFGFVQFVEIKNIPVVKEKSTSKEKIEEKTTKPTEVKPEKKKEKTVTQPKVSEKKNLDQSQQPEQKNSKQETSVTSKTPKSESSPPEETKPQKPQEPVKKEVITSDKSDLKIAINEKKESTNKKDEKDQTKQTGTENKVSSETTKPKSPPPPPPPPPEAGDLIGIPSNLYYPKDLINEGRTGSVELNVSVNDKGQIEQIEITKSSGIDAMDRNAKSIAQRGFKITSYKNGYSIDVKIDYVIDKQGNPKININLGKPSFK